jgi:hypothetical protein
LQPVQPAGHASQQPNGAGRHTGSSSSSSSAQEGTSALAMNTVELAAQLLQHVYDAREGLRARQVSNVLWALSHLVSAGLLPPVLDVRMMAAEQRPPSSNTSSNHSSSSSSSSSNNHPNVYTNGAVSQGQQDISTKQHQLLQHLLHAANQRWGAFSAQEVVSVGYAVAALGLTVDACGQGWVSCWVRACTRALHSGMTPQGAANTVWALAHLLTTTAAAHNDSSTPTVLASPQHADSNASSKLSEALQAWWRQLWKVTGPQVQASFSNGSTFATNATNSVPSSTSSNSRQAGAGGSTHASAPAPVHYGNAWGSHSLALISWSLARLQV